VLSNLVNCNENGGVQLTEEVCKEIMKLAEIVVNKHFSGYSYDKEELRSVAILKGIELLKAGTYRSEKASLKNYLYTGMRNEVGNFLYRDKKSIPVEDIEIFSGGVDDSLIDEELVAEVIKWMGSRFSRYLSCVLYKLGCMGLCPYKEDSSMDESVKVKTTEKLICLILWKNQEYCL